MPSSEELCNKKGKRDAGREPTVTNLAHDNSRRTRTPRVLVVVVMGLCSDYSPHPLPIPPLVLTAFLAASLLDGASSHRPLAVVWGPVSVLTASVALAEQVHANGYRVRPLTTPCVVTVGVVAAIRRNSGTRAHVVAALTVGAAALMAVARRRLRQSARL